jgi:hypothetical protein
MSTSYEHRIVLKEKILSAGQTASTRIADLIAGPRELRRRQTDNPNPPPTTTGGLNEDETDDQGPFRSVVFESTPDIDEQGSVLYISIDEIRAPGSVSVYIGSPARTFNINHKFISRSPVEAQKTWRALNILRSWRMPDSGQDDGYGSAPAVLGLYGYGNTFRGIPVVITSLSFNWNSETDYIKSNNFSDIPIILPCTIALKEMRTAQDLTPGGGNGWNIDRFREGTLPGW